MGDGFYRSKDPTNSIKVLKEQIQCRKKWPPKRLALTSTNLHHIAHNFTLLTPNFVQIRRTI